MATQQPSGRLRTPNKNDSNSRLGMTRMSPVMLQMVDFFSRQVTSSPDGKEVNLNDASAALPTVNETTQFTVKRTPKTTVTRIGRFEITEYDNQENVPDPNEEGFSKQKLPVSPVKLRASGTSPTRSALSNVTNRTLRHTRCTGFEEKQPPKLSSCDTEKNKEIDDPFSAQLISFFNPAFKNCMTPAPAATPASTPLCGPVQHVDNDPDLEFVLDDKVQRISSSTSPKSTPASANVEDADAKVAQSCDETLVCFDVPISSIQQTRMSDSPKDNEFHQQLKRLSMENERLRLDKQTLQCEVDFLRKELASANLKRSE
mmetsp:Transcript_46389/g.91300  ORF Transcript_46389/g.91300 Transcript_46389/m.91300 type:complete len:316 (-) Transcript_46389:112-1059(-)|eukprot:CAMPEP_0175151972 /NCGR_PEP_ID=MMETSP0087-20121206/18833_1 /TAXON_ID=136419 /ORGANISM="Unknown Unknown, Strain D1" /LENGTH=315 /DNA_ID=CAMNT_0016438309 /DNA_START=25 /DNA_END=972 /DNA_ORIENTATION=+